MTRCPHSESVESSSDPVIPTEHVIAPSIIVWLECEAYVVGGTRHYKNWLRSHGLVGEALARNVEPNMQTRRGMTWETLAADAGVSRRTLANQLAWRRTHGLLATVTHGRHGHPHNMAAEYALIVPVAVLEALYGEFWAEELEVEYGALSEELRRRVRGTQASIVAGPWDDVPWPVATVPFRMIDPEVAERVRARRVDETCTPRFSRVSLVGSANLPRRGARSYTDAPYPLTATPTKRRHRIAAGERIRRDQMVLRGLSAKDLGRIGKPIFDRGGTLGDFLHVLNTHPEMGQWTAVAAVLGEPRRRNWRSSLRLRAMLEKRVSVWLGSDGNLVRPLPSQVTLAGRPAPLAEQARLREETARRTETLERATAEIPRRTHVPSMLPAETRADLHERLAAARTTWVTARKRNVAGTLLLAQRRAAEQRRKRAS
ncbi:hypothetical protein GCM10009733_021620 [Nonomuraea maheshkhaliensis]|uniref:Uncharacterized protein n=1 Tax=Nonomuraea maheshkhaliensis TaxID=419590 RepID=A0ABN2F047_9ACTN